MMGCGAAEGDGLTCRGYGGAFGQRAAGWRRRRAFGRWAGDGGFDDGVGLVRCFRVCCCFYDGAAPRKIIVLRGGGYGSGDGKAVGGGAEGTKGIFVLAAGRRREGLMMVGGFVRS